MRNKKFKIAVFYHIFLIFGLIFNLILPLKAKALASVDQVCSTGVAGSNSYTFLSH